MGERMKMSKIRRVFLSHTSEFTKYPEKKSFIDAAIAAVNRAGCVPCDMEYFTARDEQPAQYCIERVRECEVYVGVIGLCYGSPVRDRPEVSYTELEFEAASQAPTSKRLVFLLDPDSPLPVGRFMDIKYGDRQLQFRQRLEGTGVTCKPFNNAHELEMLIFQALKDDAEEVEEPSARHVRIPWPKDKSPYPGLLWFDEEYAPLFFGRDREVDELVGKMSEPGGRVLLVSGASGSGKSSLVAAGLWQAVINERRLAGSERWVWQRIQPGDGESPFHSLAWGLKQAFPRISKRAPDLAKELAGNQTTIGELLAPHLAQGQELVLFIDQLEELFTRGFQNEDIQNFLTQLVETTHQKHNRLRVVATVRDEFLGRLAESEAMLQVLNAGYNYYVGPVSPRALQDMIEQPAQATGYDFDPGLVDDILRDAAQEPGSLPLVAYALKELFDRCERTFTREAYKAINGVAGAIGTKADQVMKDLDEQVGGAFDTVFAELVHLEREHPPTRKRASLVAFTTHKAANQLIDALAGPDCRILVRGSEEQETTVEVAHEKLFTAWPQLKHWIDGSGEALRLIDYAEEAAKRWEKTGSHLEDLWRSERAREVEQALFRFNKPASPQLKALLHPQQMLEERLKNEMLSHEERLEIGKKLAEFGDTRPGVGCLDGLPDIAWIDIPGGHLKLEDIDHVFKVKPFRIAKYPVTNIQYQSFVDDGGYKTKKWWKGFEKQELQTSDWQESNVPRGYVSWYEAVAFCRWLTARTGVNIRLPTEWEWQQAATGGDPEREYPWIGGWDEQRCNSKESGLDRPVAVGLYLSGATHQGVLDMAGNVWEWCLNTEKNPESQESVCLDDLDSPREIRGGAWFNGEELLQSSVRYWYSPDNSGGGFGFRLAQDIH